MARYKCAKARNGVVRLRPSLEIYSWNADELVPHAHQVLERQDPCHIKPRAGPGAQTDAIDKFNLILTCQHGMAEHALPADRWQRSRLAQMQL
ncbi:hypothetical protein GCM10011577_15170 [Pseudarthrobacter polychromogenes]|uniref:Transposase n=1 Tax=Pseudarthrobacter polychromogenes TaxID=1676 RepID=A0ABQ1XFQ9_9MICC|nr:hypothetical protein GCM10011577_15170 [Pseudarthrobacter polychromogenes]